MPRAKHHPNSHFERQGQVNIRQDGLYYSVNFARSYSQEIRTGYIFVSKRKGLDSRDNKESALMSQHDIDYLKEVFPRESFMRYKVNIYFKDPYRSKELSDAK